MTDTQDNKLSSQRSDANDPDHPAFATGRPRQGEPQRALPGWVVDLAHYGVDRNAFKNEPKGIVVGRELWRTALHAQYANLTEIDWLCVVDKPVTGGLARQVRTDRRGLEIHQVAARKKFAGAWKDAWRWRLSHPDPWTREEAAQRIGSLAEAVVVRLSTEAAMADTTKKLVTYAAKVAAARGSQQITLSNESFARGAGLGITAWRTAIKRAVAAGYVTVVTNGERRAPGRKPRATVYRLSLPNLPGTGASRVGEATSSSPASGPQPTSSAPAAFTQQHVLQVLGPDALAALTEAGAL